MPLFSKTRFKILEESPLSPVENSHKLCVQNESELISPQKSADQIYRDALNHEGIQVSEELVRRLQAIHRGTLTAALVLRAFNAHRRARLGARSEVE